MDVFVARRVAADPEITHRRGTRLDAYLVRAHTQICTFILIIIIVCNQGLVSLTDM